MVLVAGTNRGSSVALPGPAVQRSCSGYSSSGKVKAFDCQKDGQQKHLKNHRKETCYPCKEKAGRFTRSRRGRGRGKAGKNGEACGADYLYAGHDWTRSECGCEK